jgi:hypothetical protein
MNSFLYLTVLRVKRDMGVGGTKVWLTPNA